MAILSYKTEVKYMKPGPSMSGKQEKTAQIGGSALTVPALPATLPHIQLSCGLMASIPNGPLLEKEKAWTCFPNEFTCYAGTRLKWVTIAL